MAPEQGHVKDNKHDLDPSLDTAGSSSPSSSAKTQVRHTESKIPIFINASPPEHIDTETNNMNHDEERPAPTHLTTTLAPENATQRTRRNRSQSPRNSWVRTSWVAYLHKGDLEYYCRELELDYRGTVNELRSRLTQFINTADNGNRILFRLQEWERYQTTVMTNTNRPFMPRLRLESDYEAPLFPEGGSELDQGNEVEAVSPSENPIGCTTAFAPPIQYSTTEVRGNDVDNPFRREEIATSSENGHYNRQAPLVIIQTLYGNVGSAEINIQRPLVHIDDRTYERARTWGLYYDCQTNPIDFIQQVEDMAQQQRVALNQVPYVLAPFLHGATTSWWRNRRHTLTSWHDFRTCFLKYILPSDYGERLGEEILRNGNTYETHTYDTAPATPMDPASRKYTAFTVPGCGLFQWWICHWGFTQNQQLSNAH